MGASIARPSTPRQDPHNPAADSCPRVATRQHHIAARRYRPAPTPPSGRRGGPTAAVANRALRGGATPAAARRGGGLRQRPGMLLPPWSLAGATWVRYRVSFFVFFFSKCVQPLRLHTITIISCYAHNHILLLIIHYAKQRQALMSSESAYTNTPVDKGFKRRDHGTCVNIDEFKQRSNMGFSFPERASSQHL